MNRKEYELSEKEQYMREEDGSVTVFLLTMLMLFFYPVLTIIITALIIAGVLIIFK